MTVIVNDRDHFSVARLLRYAVRAAALVQGVFVCINCGVSPRTFPAFYMSTLPRILHPAFYTTPYVVCNTRG